MVAGRPKELVPFSLAVCNETYFKQYLYDLLWRTDCLGHHFLITFRIADHIHSMNGLG